MPIDMKTSSSFLFHEIKTISAVEVTIKKQLDPVWSSLAVEIHEHLHVSLRCSFELLLLEFPQKKTFVVWAGASPFSTNVNGRYR